MEIELPQDVLNIINILNEHDYAAYAVGGCIRDLLLGNEPKDYDIMTNATPSQVKQVFKSRKAFKIIPTGEKFGTLTLQVNENQYEVTTFRTDVYSEFSDGRRPDIVNFGKSLTEDLERRDFTINALAYNPLVGLIDLYDGQKDLGKGIIRCVGKPADRFKEDGLRILRALRFAVRYNFTIDKDTLKAMNKYSANDYYELRNSYLENLSKERIHSELIKILDKSESDGSQYVRCNPIFDYLFKKDAKLNSSSINNNLNYMQNLYNLLNFYSYDKVNSELWLREYKFTNNEIKTILNFFSINQFISENKISNESYLARLLLSKFPERDLDNYFNMVDKSFVMVLNNNISNPTSLRDLKVKGNDLIELGYHDLEIKEILNNMLDMVLKEPELNVKEKLLELI